MSVLLFFISLLLPASLSFAGEWSYGVGFRDDLLYLHSLINYDFDPDWQQTWERDLMRKNALRVSFGSISKTELLQNEELAINQPLGRGWWFRGNYTRYLSRHRDTDLDSRYFGFQKEVVRHVFLSAAGDVRHDKEYVDGAFGILVANGARDQYSLLEFAWDDLAYDDRNHLGGVTRKAPLGVQWLLRAGIGSWIVTSNGKVTTGFSRDYPDIRLSPDILHHEQRENRAQMTLTRNFPQKSRLELKISLYHFAETQLFTQFGNDYSYRDDIVQGTVRYLLSPGESDRLRLEANTVRQRARARGSHQFLYRRGEYLPGIFWKHVFPGQDVEVGYFSSVFRWENDDRLDSSDDLRNGYMDKVRLGWTVQFNPGTRLNLSLSHVVNISSFGGGNAQFMMAF